MKKNKVKAVNLEKTASKKERGFNMWKSEKQIAGVYVNVMESRYNCDIASLKINNLYLSNGYGDGTFRFYFVEYETVKGLFYKDNSFENKNIFIRNAEIFKYDCSETPAFKVKQICNIWQRGTSFYLVVDSFDEITKMKGDF